MSTDSWIIVVVMIVVSLTMTGRIEPDWLTVPLTGLVMRHLTQSQHPMAH